LGPAAAFGVPGRDEDELLAGLTARGFDFGALFFGDDFLGTVLGGD